MPGDVSRELAFAAVVETLVESRCFGPPTSQPQEAGRTIRARAPRRTRPSEGWQPIEISVGNRSIGASGVQDAGRLILRSRPHVAESLLQLGFAERSEWR